jgi:hypothetical protein
MTLNSASARLKTKFELFVRFRRAQLHSCRRRRGRRMSRSDDNEMWLRFLRGFERGLRGDDVCAPLTIEMPRVFNELRRIDMTQQQRVLVAEALRNVADQIEHEPS